ncbi:MAG: hypothetical protein DWQ36_05315 [Acidobacteria bacterium]|nr:MAG: hypothetical protein DWQ36_05315 [Acidobacteriota bacterium]
MVAGLSSLFDRAEKLGGMHFVVTGLVPTSILVLANLFIASLFFDGVGTFLGKVNAEVSLDQALQWLALLGGVVLLAFVSWSLLPWMRTFLEGDYLPDGLRIWLSSRQLAKRDTLTKEQGKLLDLIAKFREVAGVSAVRAYQEPDPQTYDQTEHAGPEVPAAEMQPSSPASPSGSLPSGPAGSNGRLLIALLDAICAWLSGGRRNRETDPEPDPPQAGTGLSPRMRMLWIHRLVESRDFGRKRGAKERPTDQSFASFEGMEKMRDLRARGQLIPFDTAKSAFEALSRDLKGYSEDSLPELEGLREELYLLARYGLSAAESQYSRLSSRVFFGWASESGAVAPTSMGQAAARLQHYGFERYRMQMDLVWPRLQQLTAKNETFTKILNQAQSRLDFAVTMTFGFALTALVWTWLAPAYGESTSPVEVAPSFAAWTLAILFYQVAVWAYRNYGEVSCSALDHFRFDLLQALHLKLPTNSAEERDLWELWCNEARLLGEYASNYEHPPNS